MYIHVCFATYVYYSANVINGHLDHSSIISESVGRLRASRDRRSSGPGVLSNREVVKLLTGLRVPHPSENKAVDFQMGLGSDSKQI